MRTLIIHPEDETTDFLCAIYSNKNWTIIRDDLSQDRLEEQIIAHERIIMLGHGSYMGLFGFDDYVIDEQMVYLLKDKYCICIWCYAAEFVEEHGLKGFYTGMFISELEEAFKEDIYPTIDEIQKSNQDFARVLNEVIDEGDILKQMKKYYNHDCSEVVKFNRDRLFCELN
ncbi:MAG: hypothetical protein JEZ09_14500 [Salinivirgaceae bacterium]|nr:hypothetical protein [Salinivirgaceae bacterium]